MTVETKHEGYRAPSGSFLYFKGKKDKIQFRNECSNHNIVFFKEANLLYKMFSHLLKFLLK